VLSAEDGARAIAAQLGAQAAEGLRPQPGDVALRSSLTGEVVAGECFDGDHWRRGLAADGRLAELVAGLCERGPGRAPLVLLHLGVECPEVAALARPGCEVVAALGDADAAGAGPEAVAAALLAAAGRLYTLGCAPDPRLMYAEPASAVALPTYPWQRRRYWLDGAAAAEGARP
jgi:acyl transferase domain-containing protein